MRQVEENMDSTQRRQIRREKLKQKRLRRKKIQKRLLLLTVGVFAVFFLRSVVVHFVLNGENENSNTVFQRLWNKDGAVLGTVMLDAGHGGNDCGTTEAELPEKEVNIQIALKIQTELEKRGIRVFMTRKDDTYVSLKERVEMAKKEQPDIFLSIHQNSFEDGNVRGTEIWYNEEKRIGGDKSRVLAERIQEEIIKDSQVISRGIVEDQELQVLRETEVPAVLMEIGYVTNAEDWKQMTSPDYQEMIAGYIAEAVKAYLLQQNGDELV